MTHRFAYLFAAIAIGAVGLAPAQQATQGSDPSKAAARAPLAFEVASVKPADPGARGGRGIRPLPGGQTYVADGVPLRLMITLMYRITNAQLVGGPDWINTDRWDVQAKAEKPSSIDELHEMFQTLFADRFKLKFHREMRTITTLALVVDKPGKMKRDDSGEPFDIPIKGSGKPFELAGTRVPMAYLSWFISQRLDRPVIDRTELPGFYNFTLAFLPDLPPGADTINGQPLPDLPDIYRALKEQLGLKLESQKGQVEFFVIDHAEKPSENQAVLSRFELGTP